MRISDWSSDVCSSDLDSHFRRILSDPNAPADDKVERLVLCTGKLFYDLAEARDAAGDEATTIVRIEPLYPFPSEALVIRLQRMTNQFRRALCRDKVCPYV